MKSSLPVLFATGTLASLAAAAGQAPAEQVELTTVTVTASKLRALDQETGTSSRLDLTPVLVPSGLRVCG